MQEAARASAEAAAAQEFAIRAVLGGGSLSGFAAAASRLAVLPLSFI